MSLKQKLRQFLSFVIRHRFQFQLQLQAEIRGLRDGLKAAMPDNPAAHGFKVYSQFDEDGIIEEIFRRIGDGRTFVEIGCGNGLENNTHYLLLKGWSGTWVDGSEQNIAEIRQHLPANKRLKIVGQIVDRENVRDLVPRELDLLSLDIDGNDLEVLTSIMTVSSPKVICVEYNGKFPPPTSVSIRYDPSHTWAHDDYYGASLQAFVDLLEGYKLVACGLSGANAFFVRKDVAGKFSDYPVGALYQPHRVHLIFLEAGAIPSYKFLANELARAPTTAAR
jgi:hypothetical protein